jgi:hypothetical protein
LAERSVGVGGDPNEGEIDLELSGTHQASGIGGNRDIPKMGIYAEQEEGVDREWSDKGK